jgi:hypothetical protein
VRLDIKSLAMVAGAIESAEMNRRAKRELQPLCGKERGHG